MCFSEDLQKILNYLGKFYTLKVVGYPQFYLGGEVVQLLDSLNQDYGFLPVRTSRIVLGTLEMICETAFAPANTPFDTNYHTEWDTLELCCIEEHSRYHSLIGNINWCVTIYYVILMYITYSIRFVNILLHWGLGTFLLPNIFWATSRNILMECSLSMSQLLLFDNKIPFTKNETGLNSSQCIWRPSPPCVWYQVVST